MERRGATLGGGLQKIRVGLHIGSGEILVVVIWRQRLRLQQAPRQLHAGDNDAAIKLGGEIVGLDDRLRKRIGRADADIAAAFGALLPGGDRHARQIFQRALHAFLVTRRRERQLQVGAFGGLAGMPEAIDHGRRQRQQAAPGRRPFDGFADQIEAAPALVDGLDVLDARDRARRVVILQALADAGQRMTHLDAVRSQQLRRTDAGQLQKLRRVIGAAGQNHLFRRAHLMQRAVLAAAPIAHADRALALEDDFGRVRMRAHIDIAALARRMQKGGGGADAKAVLDGALGVGYALLNRTVVIGIARNAERDRACHEGLAQRILPVHGGDGEIAVAAAIGVVARADALFESFEIRQDVRIAPATVAELRPGVEVLALAAVVDVAVDRGRAAERLAARRVDAATAGPWTWLLLIAPTDAAHVEGLDEAGRQMNIRVPVARTGLEHADFC